MQPSLLSTVGEVLVVVAQEPDARVREIAQTLGVTERTVIHALRILEDGRVISVHRNGRRNHYKVRADATLRIAGSTLKVNRLLDALEPAGSATTESRGRRTARAG